MSHKKRVTYLVMLPTLIFLLSSCATTSLSYDLARTRMATLGEAHAQDSEFEIRLNPAPCDCPPVEVRLDGAWHRVFLEPTDLDGPAEAANAWLSNAAGAGDRSAIAQVSGRISGSVRNAGNGSPCLVLRVLALCPDTGCVPAE
jgi:hypothetical protein